MKTFRNFSLAIATMMAIMLTGCKEDRNDPQIPVLSPKIVNVVEGSTTQITVTSGVEPFSVRSSDESKASARVEGRSVTVTGVAEGTSQIFVTGADGGSAEAAAVVARRAANAPLLGATAVDVEVDGTANVTISGGTPEFTVVGNPADIAEVKIENSTVVVRGLKGGTTLVTVTGSDNASATFAVTVNDEQIFFGPSKTQLGNGMKSFSIRKSHTISRGTYTMVGWIYVEDGATLTIEPGTVIRCSDESYDGRKAATGSSLIVQRGAKIMAQGTAAAPIVFTSSKDKGKRQATDWGGIIICGKARNNQGTMTIEGGVEADHGGANDDDNSGVLSYVRIEFGGYPYALDNEINGLTLGSVGRGTQIDHVQVSYAGDDSFEWFGGTVNCKYLVAYHGWDDDFDTDNGYSGKLQFLLGVRDPKVADQSNSNGFESDNNASGSTQEPYTTCVFSNVTIIGPTTQDPAFVNASGSGYISGYNWGVTTGAAFPIRTGIFQSAIQIRRNSRLSCFNSVFTGYPVGLMLSNDGRGDTQGAAANGQLKLKNIVFAGMGTTGADADKKDPSQWSGDVSSTYFKRSDLNNREFASLADLKLKQPNGKLLPMSATGYSANDLSVNWGPQSGSPLLGAASFTDQLLADSFFNKTVTYIGAFAGDSDADNWTKGWCNFDPQNTDY